jgi:prepilin-type N-terminal cleavage/methylation domain-containing protein
MQLKYNSKKESGFTLIELSIVLIIIGLIVGGVLVGQDLIDAAKMRAQIQQIQQYDTLVSTFRTKYDGLPGDLSRAAQFFTGSLNGDGNSRIEVSNATAVEESNNFWNHVSLAGMTPRSYAIGEFETTKLDRDSMGVFYASGANQWALGIADNVTWGNGFTGLEAFQIDSKLDDANPATGYVRAAEAAFDLGADIAGGGSGLGTPDATNCADATPAYIIDETNGNEPLCPVRVRMNVG